VVYLLAVAAAAAFGAGDFLGGLASRRTGVLVTTAAAQAAGFSLMLPALLLVVATPDRTSLVWGGVGGLAGCVGLLVFFRALSDGVMSTVAPVTAVIAAGLPIVVSVALGARPGSLAWLGVGVGMVAVIVIGASGREHEQAARRREPRDPLWAVVLALAAGVGFGVFFVCLSRTSPSAGLWPLAAARMTALTLLGVNMLVKHAELRADAEGLRLAIPSGVLDQAANVLFLYAVHRGVLALVAVLVSLYPAVTVILALALLRERLRATQVAGVALALVAVVLIAAS